MSEVRPLFPRAVPYGCGAASIVAILILFGIGVFAGSGKGGSIFGSILGMMAGEIDGMFTKEVSKAQRDAFEAEMKSLEKNLSQGKVSIDKVQPLLRTIRDTSGDNAVTPKEAEMLIQAARAANEVAPLRGSAVSRSPNPATPQPRNPAPPR